MEPKHLARSQRDVRLDVIRALVLLAIFIDHIPNNIFERLTLKNFGFADAAEVFVMVSGMAVALAYARPMQTGPRLLPWLRMWRRAGVLYVAHIMTSVVTLAIFCGAAILRARPDILQVNNIHALIDTPAEAMFGLGILGHQLGYNNILSLYAVLLFAAPLMLWCLSRSLWQTVAVSGLVWLLAGIWQIAPSNYPTDGFWFLNPLSWQFLFVIGMASVIHARRGGRLPRILVPLSVAYLVAAFAFIHSPLWGVVTWFNLPPVLGGFDKTFLSLSRLLDILALACLASQSRWLAKAAASAMAKPLAIMGQFSLPVFILGVVLAMLAQVYRAIQPPSLSLDIIIVSGGIALHLAFGAYLLWWRNLQRGASTPKATLSTASAAVPSLS